MCVTKNNIHQIYPTDQHFRSSNFENVFTEVGYKYGFDRKNQKKITTAQTIEVHFDNLKMFLLLSSASL